MQVVMENQKEKTVQIERIRLMVCAVRIISCPARCLAINNQHCPVMTERGNPGTFTLPGRMKGTGYR